jgi:hypothetical protein
MFIIEQEWKAAATCDIPWHCNLVADADAEQCPAIPGRSQFAHHNIGDVLGTVAGAELLRRNNPGPPQQSCDLMPSTAARRGSTPFLTFLRLPESLPADGIQFLLDRGFTQPHRYHYHV